MFVARVATPLLLGMWSAHVRLGSVPEIDHGSAGSKLKAEVQGAHVSIKRASWVMDTGSGHDLAPQQVVDSSSVSVTTPRTSLSLSTANGPIAVESVAQIRIAALSSTSEALVLPLPHWR